MPIVRPFKWFPKIMGQKLKKAFDEILFEIESSSGDYDYNFDQILETISKNLKKINIASLFAVYDVNRENIIFKKLTLPFDTLDIPEFPPFPIKKFFTYNIVIETQRPIYTKNRVSQIKKNYVAFKDYLEAGIPTSGDANSIVSPIIIKGEVIGFLELFSPELKKGFIKIIEQFTKELAHEIAHIILFNEVKKSKEKYYDLFANAQEGFFIVNARKKKYIEVNKGFCELTGYTKEELMQMNYLIPFSPEERLKTNVYVKNRLEETSQINQAPSEYETKILTKKGEMKYVLLKIARIIHSDEWFIIVFDKTEKKLAEKALHKNEEMYRKLVESAGSIILRRKTDGTITFFNEYAEKFFGWSKEEIIGKNVVGTIVPKIDSMGNNLEIMIKNISQNPENFSDNQNENIKKDGARVWVAWNNKGIFNENSELIGILAVGIDLTDRKKAEIALQNSEEKFRALTENSLDVIMRFDKNLRHLYVNPQVEKQTGIPVADFIGKTHKEMNFPKDLVEVWEKAIKKTLNTGKKNQIEFMLPNNIWIDWLLIPEFSKNNEVKGVITAARDITERKIIEENLKKNEEKIKKLNEFNQRILDNAPVSIITINKEGIITSTNKYFWNFANGPEIVKTNIFNNSFFLRENLVKKYKKLLAEGTPVKAYNRREKNIHGEDKFLNIIAVPLYDQNNQIEEILSMAIDNTDAMIAKKQLEELNKELEEKILLRTNELSKLNKKLKEVLDLKTKFIADASHELRTPLTIIKGNLNLVIKEIGSCSTDVTETMEIIDKEVSHISNILADLSLLTNADAKDNNLNIEKINLTQSIETIIKSTRVLMAQKNINATIEKEGNDLTIFGDEIWLEKLFLNLIQNAIKYNKKDGWIKVVIKKNNTNAIIEIIDNGIGIPEKDLTNIFERFYRVDKSRSRNEGGSGLGLAICKWIVEAHDGAISAKSDLGKGSVFTVILPIKNADNG